MLSERSPQLVGRAPAFLQALTLIERMARYDAPVLIVGETGTGKELAARAIHYESERRDAPFVPLNCGAVPETLIESELFGCERGAFTDARQARSGGISSSSTLSRKARSSRKAPASSSSCRRGLAAATTRTSPQHSRVPPTGR